MIGRSSSRLAHRILLWFAPFFAILLAVSLWLSFSLMDRAAERYVPNASVRSAEVGALQTLSVIGSVQSALYSGKEAVMSLASQSQQSLLLKKLKTANPSLRRLWLIGPDGMEIANTSIDNKYLQMELSPQARGALFDEKSPDRVRLSQDDIPVMEICEPVEKWRKTVAALCAELDFRNLWEALDAVKIGRTGYIFLVSEDGHYLSHPIKSKVLKSETYSKMERILKQGPQGHYFEDEEGRSWLTAHFEVSPYGWHAVAVQDAAEAFRHYRYLKDYAVFFSLLLIPVGGLAFLFISRNIARPVERLTEATKIVAEGNLEHKIEIESRDEIGRLAESFNAMVERLNRSRKMLIQTEKLSSIGQFASSLAHEIQNPLSGLLGYVYLLKEGPSSEDVTEYARDMEEALLNIQDTLKRLLTLSKQGEYRFGPVDLNEVAAHCLKLLGHHLSRFDRVRVESAMGENLPKVQGDKGLLQQALINILLNAGRAASPEGTVSISTRNEGKFVVATIEDDGEGIAPADREKIFEPFFSGKSSTGLGLYVTREIVKLHNGTITLESEQGKGTRFNLRFEAARPGE